MFSALLVDATDLGRWANRRDAQALLPRLVRRLIHATVERVLRSGFPAGEGVQLPGWDGIVAAEHGNAFVPEGTSAWELTTRHDTATKADEDYRKRTSEPQGVDPRQSTFVFVTARRWGTKEAWVNARQHDGVWHEVRAYDADDLETWLELAPPVHVWLSILLGKHPEAAIDVINFWADWSETTRPPTSMELVLSGRSEVAEQMRAWLREPSALPLTLQAESRDEALAVFTAVIIALPPEEQEATLSRAVIVRDVAAWQHMSATDEPLILVPTFDAPEAIGNAARHGHRIVIPLGRADSASNKSVVIPRLSRQDAEKALVASGVAEDQARDLAALARRSLMAFRRKLALSPATQQPAWARPSEARALLPAVLAGAWSDGRTSERDRQALSTLAQMPYGTMVEVLVRWSHEADPPVRQVGDAWYIVSKEDAWYLLGRYLTLSDLDRLQQVVSEVLGTPDPMFDLPEEQRWMAGALGHSAANSSLLRAGLADTLAMLGTRGETIAVGDGMSARDYASLIVLRLLQKANTDWRVWASLSRSLPLLAEAAPDNFLAAVEEGLSGAQPLLRNLFSENEDPLFSSSPHTGLLWALETLAWSPEHLGRVALVIASLCAIDPGGKLANRPPSTLCQIFLPWHPQTAATLEQRLRVLDTLRERQPGVAWNLLVGLIPEAYGIAHNTPKPRWREWGAGCSSRISRREVLNAVGEVVTRMLADVGRSGPRWRNLIEALASLPMEQYEAVVRALSKIDAAGIATSDRTEIWNALRKLISHHRSFPDADWALPNSQINRLDELYRRFDPQELSGRYAWLFSQTPELPEGENREWEAQHQAIADARLQAARAVCSSSRVAGLLELAGCVQLPFELGMTIGRSELLETEEDELLSDHLAAEDAVNAQFAAGLATGRITSRGREWAEAKLATLGDAWSPAQRAQLLVCLPADSRTWNLSERWDGDTETRYWRLVYPFLIDRSGSIEEIEHAVRKLLKHGRPFSAIEFLASAVRGDQGLLATLVAEALERALRTKPQDDRPSNSFPYHLSKLLDMIESNPGDERRLAALEWGWLPLFRGRERPPKLLHRELARNPEFFAELVELAYPAEGEEPREATDDERLRAEHASRLLDSWRRLPGAADDGTIDDVFLQDWVRRARSATIASGRGAAGDELIGRVLSASPQGPDGGWPLPAVCGLIDTAASRDLDGGFEIGLYNSRGMVSRDPTEGGKQERQLADQYDKFAAAASDRWPRTAAMLRRIAELYRAEARREDQESELEQDLP